MLTSDGAGGSGVGLDESTGGREESGAGSVTATAELDARRGGGGGRRAGAGGGADLGSGGGGAERDAGSPLEGRVGGGAGIADGAGTARTFADEMVELSPSRCSPRTVPTA